MLDERERERERCKGRVSNLCVAFAVMVWHLLAFLCALRLIVADKM